MNIILKIILGFYCLTVFSFLCGAIWIAIFDKSEIEPFTEEEVKEFNKFAEEYRKKEKEKKKNAKF